MNMQMAELKCPFCKKPFELPSEYQFGQEYKSSCDCGASFLLEQRNDVGTTIEEIKEDGLVEIRLLENIDFLTETKEEEPKPWDGVTAIFWK